MSIYSTVSYWQIKELVDLTSPSGRVPVLSSHVSLNLTGVQTPFALLLSCWLTVLEDDIRSFRGGHTIHIICADLASLLGLRLEDNLPLVQKPLAKTCSIANEWIMTW
jgi:hypothetical protein